MCYVIAFSHNGSEDNHFWEKMKKKPTTRGLSGEQAGWKEGKGHPQCAIRRLWFSWSTLGKEWWKSRKSTLFFLLSHVPPSAVSREMKVPCPRRHRPPGTCQAGWARLSPFLLAYLSLSLAPLCFCFHVPRAIIRLSFCTPLRFLFHLSQTPSKFSKKFLFCFVISSSGVCSVVCILQKQQCVFRLLFFRYVWQSLPPHASCSDLCLSASPAPGSGHLCVCVAGMK